MAEKAVFQNKKKWYESKTIWINVLSIVAGLATGFSDLLSTGGAITVVASLNIFLRVISQSKLE